MKFILRLSLSLWMCVVFLNMLNGQNSFDEYYKNLTFKPFASYDVGNLSASNSTVNVVIDSDSVINPISQAIHGQNGAFFHSQFNLSNTREQNWKNGEFTFLRYPGGNASNQYFWDGNLPATIQYESVLQGNPANLTDGSTAWHMDSDEFMQVVSFTGAEPIYCVNMAYAFYGTTADPIATAASYACDWMRDLIAKGTPVKYWELGNENYGSWTVARDLAGAQEYADACKVFADSMRAVDPTIELGVVLTEFSTDNWNEVVLAEVGDLVDYGIIHIYPHPKNDQNVISEENMYLAIEEVHNKRSQVVAQVETFTNKSIEDFPIAITEYNARAGTRNLSRSNVLFTTMFLGEFAKEGIEAAMQWDLQNGYSTGGGDHGMTSVRDPFLNFGDVNPEFYAHYYMRKYFGDHLVQSTSSNDKVLTYSTTFSSGELGLVIVNTSDLAQTVDVDLGDYKPGERAYWHLINGDYSDFDRTVYVNGVGPTATFTAGVDYTSTFGQGDITETATSYETNGVSGPQNYELINPRSAILPFGQSPSFDLPRYSVMYIIFDQVEDDCVIPDLGADVSLCGVSDITLSTGLSSTGKSFSWYNSLGQLVGSLPTLDVSVGDTYSVLVDSATCTYGDVVEVFDDIPSFTFGTDRILCDSVSYKLSADVQGPGLVYTWTKDGDVIGGNDNSLVVYEAGNYQLEISGGTCVNQSDDIDILSNLLDVTHDTICVAGDVTLTVNTSNNIAWYDAAVDGMLLSTDLLYEPTVTESTTFYVQDNDAGNFMAGLSGFESGAATNTTWAASNYSGANRQSTLVVTTAFTLNSVKVNSASGITAVLNLTGPTNHSFSKSLAGSGWHTIPVGVTLQPGTYNIDFIGSGGGLIHQTDSGGGADNEYSGYFSFYGNSGGVGSDYYGFLFDIDFSVGIVCSRTPVYAIIDPLKDGCTVNPCMSKAAMITAATVVATEECEAIDGWTHYTTSANPNDIVFSIQKGMNDFVAEVTITKDVGHSVTNGFDATYVMGRRWDVNVLSGVDYDFGSGALLDGNVAVRYYFDPQDSIDIENAADAYALATGGLREPFAWFKTKNGVDYSTALVNEVGINEAYELSSTSYGESNGAHYVQFDGIVGFSGGSGATGVGNASVLSVDLIEFEVNLVENEAVLIWSTASEINNEGFRLEKSYDGLNFEPITFVISGNDEGETYSFIDSAIKGGGKVYYRLVQVDIDGVETSLGIRSLTSGSTTDVYVSPNPFSQDATLYFNGLKTDYTDVTIMNSTGVVVSVNRYQNSIQEVIVGEGLARGLYYVKVSTGDVIEVVKLLKL